MSLLALRGQATPVDSVDEANEVALANDLDETVSNAEADAVGLHGEVDADEEFKIETRDQAEYYTRRLVQAQKEDALVEAVAKQRIQEYTERVNAWKESKLNENSGNIEHWIALLRPWAEEQLKGGKKKSVKLIEGTLAFRKAESYEYDEDKLIAYLKENHKELLVEQKPKINKTVLKKVFDFEKDSIPGVTYTKLPDTFTVK